MVDRAYLSMLLGLTTTGLFVGLMMGPFIAYPALVGVWLGFQYIRWNQEKSNPAYQAYWRNKKKKGVKR